jgi:hypothetical protein
VAKGSVIAKLNHDDNREKSLELGAAGAGHTGSRTGRSRAVAGTAIESEPESISGNGSGPGTESKSTTISDTSGTDTGVSARRNVLKNRG